MESTGDIVLQRAVSVQVVQVPASQSVSQSKPKTKTAARSKLSVYVVYVLGIVSAASWGSASVLMKASLEHMPALMLLVIQLVFSNAFLFILLAWRRPPLPSRQLIIIFLGVGFMAPGLAYLLTTIGLSMTSVTSETLIFSTETMMIIVLSWLFLNEPLTRSIVMLSSLALVGIVLVTLNETEEPGQTRSNLGDLLILLGTLCSALDVIVTRHYVEKIDPLWLITFTQISVVLQSVQADFATTDKDTEGDTDADTDAKTGEKDKDANGVPRSRSKGPGMRLNRALSAYGGRPQATLTLREQREQVLKKKQSQPTLPWYNLARIWAALVSIVPMRLWIVNYNLTLLKADVVAGISTGLNMLPKSLAFSLLAGLPPEFGLYSAFIPAMFYLPFGTSAHLGLGPSALVCLMTGAVAQNWCSVGEPQKDSWIGSCNLSEYEHTVRKLTFIQGVSLLALGIFRGGAVLRFFSRPLLTGFLAAAAIIISVSQFKYFFYNASTHIGDYPTVYEMLYHIFEHIKELHWPTLIFSLAMMFVIIPMQRWKPTSHTYSLWMTAATTLIALALDESGAYKGFYLTGKVAGGFPAPSFDFLIDQHYGDGYEKISVNIRDWVTVSAAIALVGFLESSSASRVYAIKYNYTIDINQEMIAVGIANIAGAIFRCFPILGAIGMSAMLSTFGGRSGMAAAISALLCGVLSYAAILFYYLPKAALAMIVMSAVWGLIDVNEVKFMYRGHRRDLLVACVLVVVTLYFGIEVGLFSAILLNVIAHVYYTSNTKVVTLGRVPGSSHFMNIRCGKPLYAYKGITMLRFKGPIFFGSEEKFKTVIYQLLRAPESISRALIIDGAPINFLDATGVHAIEEVSLKFAAQQRMLVFADCNRQVTTRLRKAGLLDAIGKDHFHDSLEDALKAVLRGQIKPSPVPPTKDEHSHTDDHKPARSFADRWSDFWQRLLNKPEERTPLLSGAEKGNAKVDRQAPSKKAVPDYSAVRGDGDSKDSKESKESRSTTPSVAGRTQTRDERDRSVSETEAVTVAVHTIGTSASVNAASASGSSTTSTTTLAASSTSHTRALPPAPTDKDKSKGAAAAGEGTALSQVV